MIYSSWDIECETLKLVIMSHFLLFYPPPPPPPKNQKNQNFEKMKKMLEISFYTSVPKMFYWYKRYRVIDIIFCHFGSFFLPFYPVNNPENQNFEKIRTASGYVIILQMCTKNHDHRMYASCDIKCDRHNFLSFWAIFPLYPTTDHEN